MLWQFAWKAASVSLTQSGIAALNVLSMQHAWHGKLGHAVSKHLLLIALQSCTCSKAEALNLAVGAHLPLTSLPKHTLLLDILH